MTQANSLTMVRSRKFIVGSIDASGYFSVSSRPFAHESLIDANRECQRLASAKPGTAYVTMQLAGGSLVPAVIEGYTL